VSKIVIVTEAKAACLTSPANRHPERNRSIRLRMDRCSRRTPNSATNLRAASVHSCRRSSARVWKLVGVLCYATTPHREVAAALRMTWW